MEDIAPSYSPDGKRIVFPSSRSGNPEIWACGSEGENPIRLTSFNGPLAGSPRWSPDGKQVVFDGRPGRNADIFVVSSEGGQPRRLTEDPAEDIVPSWSRDGRWIYFTSNRSGRLQIWKIPAEGGEAVQVTKQGGFEATESPDGQWLYYSQDRGSAAIRRIPVGGGEESPVYDFQQSGYSRMWSVVADGIYFATSESTSKSTIKFLSLPSGTVTTVASIDGSLPNSNSGLTISPDGKSLLFPLVVERGGDLMIIENFH
jgi:Tol biopolymer transport system component